jgi:hypothetical protein
MGNPLAADMIDTPRRAARHLSWSHIAYEVKQLAAKVADSGRSLQVVVWMK